MDIFPIASFIIIITITIYLLFINIINCNFYCKRNKKRGNDIILLR